MRDLVLALTYLGQRLTWALMGRLFNGRDKLRDLVNHHGIVVFVGPNGSGKSLICVDAVLPVLDGEMWECVAVDHQHNAEFVVHAETCPDCEPRTIDRMNRCRRGRFLELIGSRGVRRHVSRCSRCESRPGEFGGRCEDGSAILDRVGRGRRLVYSTVPLLDEHGYEHPYYRACTDYRQLVGIEHADVIFDEVAGVSDASDSATMPASLTRWLQQLRKRDVRLRVTTPDYDRCSKPIRQVAQVVVDARSRWPEPGDSGKRWRPRRAMTYRAYDGFAFQHFTAHQGETLDTLAVRFFWRPGCRAQDAYDTLAQVHALGDVTEHGMCMVCGGSRSRPRCACSHEVDELHNTGAELHIVEKVTASGQRTRVAVPIEDGERVVSLVEAGS